MQSKKKKVDIDLESKKDLDSPTIKCKKCGHEICPHCGDWCDTMLYSKEDKGNHITLGEEEYPILCCNGKCEI